MSSVVIVFGDSSQRQVVSKGWEEMAAVDLQFLLRSEEGAGNFVQVSDHVLWAPEAQFTAYQDPQVRFCFVRSEAS